MTTNFEVLGVNDEQDSCECCGKQGLKRVVWIQNKETGDIRHFGVVCAASPAKAFGLNSEIKKAQALWESKLRNAYMVAARLYRQRGGKYVSNGIALGENGGALVVADIGLYDLCLKEARQF